MVAVSRAAGVKAPVPSTVVRTVERAATDKITATVARVAPSCEIQDGDDIVSANQLDDVEYFR